MFAWIKRLFRPKAKAADTSSCPPDCSGCTMACPRLVRIALRGEPWDGVKTSVTRAAQECRVPHDREGRLRGLGTPYYPTRELENGLPVWVSGTGSKGAGVPRPGPWPAPPSRQALHPSYPPPKRPPAVTSMTPAPSPTDSGPDLTSMFLSAAITGDGSGTALPPAPESCYRSGSGGDFGGGGASGSYDSGSGASNSND